jgi:hypothetical protein
MFKELWPLRHKTKTKTKNNVLSGRSAENPTYSDLNHATSGISNQQGHARRCARGFDIDFSREKPVFSNLSPPEFPEGFFFWIFV